MPKFIKKPVAIEAMKWTGDNLDAIKSFCSTAIEAKVEGTIKVGTLEDGDNEVEHIASKGDYVIKGVEGEFYPCKPDIFKKTYWTEEEYAKSKDH